MGADLGGPRAAGGTRPDGGDGSAGGGAAVTAPRGVAGGACASAASGEPKSEKMIDPARQGERQ